MVCQLVADVIGVDIDHQTTNADRHIRPVQEEISLQMEIRFKRLVFIPMVAFTRAFFSTGRPHQYGHKKADVFPDPGVDFAYSAARTKISTKSPTTALPDDYATNPNVNLH